MYAREFDVQKVLYMAQNVRLRVPWAKSALYGTRCMPESGMCKKCHFCSKCAFESVMYQNDLLFSFLTRKEVIIMVCPRIELMQRPLALAKIVGAYSIGFRNTKTGSSKRLDVLVMENLLYGHAQTSTKVKTHPHTVCMLLTLQTLRVSKWID